MTGAGQALEGGLWALPQTYLEDTVVEGVAVALAAKVVAVRHDSQEPHQAVQLTDAVLEWGATQPPAIPAGSNWAGNSLSFASLLHLLKLGDCLFECKRDCRCRRRFHFFDGRGGACVVAKRVGKAAHLLWRAKTALAVLLRRSLMQCASSRMIRLHAIWWRREQPSTGLAFAARFSAFFTIATAASFQL